MPWVDDSFEEEGLDERVVGTYSQAELAKAAGRTQTHYGSAATIFGAGVGLGALDLADTVLSSVGLTEREQFNKAALRLIDKPGLNDFYRDTRGAQEVGSAIYGIIATELAFNKLSKPIDAFMATASKVPYVRRIAALDKQYDMALDTVKSVDLALARRGTLGAQQYRGMAEVPVGVFDSATGAFRQVVKPVARDSAVWSARGLAAAKGVRAAAAREAVMAVTMNQNGFLYEDDMAHNLTWMAAGLGLGAIADSAIASYRIRKMANSDLVRREFAGALDPEGFEEGRLLWHKRAVTKDEMFESFLGGAITDKITSLNVEAITLRESRYTDADPTLISSRNALSIQLQQESLDNLQKVTVKGVSTDGRTRFNMTQPGLENHAKMAMARDPGVFNGAEMIGALPVVDGERLSIHQVVESHKSRLAELRIELEDILVNKKSSKEDISAARMRLRRLDFEDSLEPMVLMDGELMPISEAESFDRFVNPDIKFTQTKGKGRPAHAGIWEVVSDAPAGRITLDDSLIPHFPSGKSVNDADHYDMLRLYKLGQRAISRLVNSTDPIVLPKKPSWFQLDMAEQILEESQGRANVIFPGKMTRESAQVESLVQKAIALRKMQEREATKRAVFEASGNTYEGQLSRLRVRFNLPKLTAYERGVAGTAEHPIDSLLRGIDLYGVDEVRQMSLGEIKELMATQKRMGDFIPATRADKESLRGNSFKFMADEKGAAIEPILVYKRPMNMPIDWNMDTIAERMAANKLFVINKLTAPDAAAMSRELTNAILQSPDFDQVARSHELMETQIQGSVFGTAPDNAFNAVGRALTTSEWRDRDATILLAATRLADTTDRLSRAHMQKYVEEAFGDLLSVVKNPRNSKSRLLLNQFHSHRSGWDLAEEPVGRDNGFVAFTLKKTEANKARFRQQFQREMGKTETLVNPNGQEIVLDALGLKIQIAYNTVTDAIAREKNTLLGAFGRPLLNLANWYTPPPDLEGKMAGYVISPDNKVVPGYTVVESNSAAFDRARTRASDKALKELGVGYTFMTRDEIREFASLWSQVEMHFVNPTLTAVQPGKSARGTLTGQSISVTAFDDSMKYLQDQFMRHGNDIKALLLQDQIQAAQMRANISGATSRTHKGFFQREKYRTIYDLYLENLLGRSKLNSPDSLVGKVFNPIEGSLDKALADMTQGGRKAMAVWRATQQRIANFVPGAESEASKKDFNTLTQHLAEYMPFKSAAEMAERQSAAKTPLTVQKISGEVNRFTAALVLRMFEVAHPIMNLAGMVNSMPSVIRHVRQLPGEADADWANRIGHSVQMFKVKGQDIGIIDMTKLASRAFKNAWNVKRHPDYQHMVRRGYTTQEIAELQMQMSSIESKGALETFFYGDSSKKGFKSKGVAGWTGILSDQSEDFTRTMGHMVGLELADLLQITGKEACHNFAHDIANKMIANYNPRNRPEIFQGGLGAPIGLFQSFIFNYYQRLFRYAETGDYKSLATQYAVQGSLFGVTSLTGWQQVNDMFMNATDGEEDVDAGIWSRFGGPAGDLLAGGAISNLPKLFGPEAVDLYSRGDTNVRLPGLGGNSIPAMNVMTKIWEGINAGLEAFSDNHPGMTSTQLAEIASNMMANRPIAGVIEQFIGGGDDTDRFGQLVVDTQSAAEATYRVLGLRSMRQSKEIEAFYSDKDAQEYQASAQDTLRRATRAAMRADNYDQLPKIFEKYLDNGGNPAHFRRWMKENYESAKTPRAQRRLDELMNNPANMSRVMNYLDMGVGITEDEELGDTESLYSTGESDELDQSDADLGAYNGQLTYDEEN